MKNEKQKVLIDLPKEVKRKLQIEASRKDKFLKIMIEEILTEQSKKFKD